jgi:hypothetical protein
MMTRTEKLQDIREILDKRNAWRITFETSNYVGERTTHTGWLLESLGFNFHKVWSDHHRRYIAVHKSHITSHTM